MQRNDGELIADYLEGDESALAALVDRYLDDIYNFSLRLTNNSQAAEDVTQESFIRAWKHIRSFVPGKSFRAWLFTIARNAAIDWLRQKKEVPLSSFEGVENSQSVMESIVDNELLPDELLERAGNAAFVQRLLEELDPRYRDVLSLRYTSNYTFAEIGKILKRPLHTVKSQHRRALAMLRRAIDMRTA